MNSVFDGLYRNHPRACYFKYNLEEGISCVGEVDLEVRDRCHAYHQSSSVTVSKRGK